MVTTFRRFLVTDHEFFSDLHYRLVPLVSRLVGEPVEPTYTQMALYSRSGVLPVHLDSPNAKWTLDICLRQSETWPIYVGRPQSWLEFDPTVEVTSAWEEFMKCEAGLDFQPYLLEPGDALLFASSNQWHYRDSMPATSVNAYCDLLFLSYVPQGVNKLLAPAKWGEYFSMPELKNAVRDSAGQAPADGQPKLEESPLVQGFP